MNKSVKIVIGIAAAAVIAGGSFYGGMLYKSSQGSSRNPASGTGRIGGRFAAGNNFIAGDIISKDTQSITVKMKDGSSRIVFYSGSTDVGKFVLGTTGDLGVGKNVMVNGKTNTDGSISAQSIQIRPAAPLPVSPSVNP